MGFYLAVLANISVGASHIEIAQRGSAQAVGVGKGRDHVVDGQLGRTIRIGGLGWHVFRNRDLVGLTVGCSGGGKDEVFDVVIPHGIKQRQGSNDVVLPVLIWFFHGFAHQGARSEVNDAFEATFAQDIGSLVRDVALDDAGGFRNGLMVAGGEIIDDGYVMALFD